MNLTHIVSVKNKGKKWVQGQLRNLCLLQVRANAALWMCIDSPQGDEVLCVHR